MPTTKLQDLTATEMKAENDEQEARSNPDKITINAAFSGAGAPNATVRFTIDGEAKGTTVSADAAGIWNFTLTGLADGQHTVVARETDTTGNQNMASLTFSLGEAEPAIAQRPGPGELVQQTSGDARDKADYLIKMFLNEIKRSNKLTRTNSLELRRELRQQYGKKIALEITLFKGSEQIFDEYSVSPLEKNWMICCARRGKTIERPATVRKLSQLFCFKNSAEVTENDVHDIVTLIVAQCGPTTTGRVS
jgi:hypothetical protein